MGGFKDTFTKDDSQDELLGYDDHAFYYFFTCFLAVFAIPWTYYFLKNLLFPSASEDVDRPGKAKAGARIRICTTSGMVQKTDEERQASRSRGRFNGCWWLQFVLLSIAWIVLVLVASQLGKETEIKSFDPFAILEVTSSATTSEIKKAYRKMSLVYHPDKNVDDPLAAARFIQITKAYSALTDEVAKSNYEKYGNPDGPTSSKVGIGLPKFLLDKEHNVPILAAFFFVLLVFIPCLAIGYYSRTKGYAANGVLIETLQFMEYHLNDATRVKNLPEMMAASAESRAMTTRESDTAVMKTIASQVEEHKKRQFNHPVIARNSFLIWAHMQRLHHLLTPELRSDLDELLKHCLRISQAIVEYACMRDWFMTAQSILDFRRSIIQALDVRSSALLQIPHFDEDVLKHCTRGRNSVKDLPDFISRPAANRPGVAKMDDQQVLDVEAFIAHVSDVELQAKIEVEDEADFVVGDIATVHVRMRRKGLQEDEAMGAVHAPLFPELKYEEWWWFLVEPLGTSSTNYKIHYFQRVRDCDAIVEEEMKFQLSGKPGKKRFEVHVMCDSYVGFDKKVDLNFTLLDDKDAKRDIFIHKEDEDLDLIPTLFQQMMGEMMSPGEEEEESDDDDYDKHRAQEQAKVKQAAAKANAPKANVASQQKNGKPAAEASPAGKGHQPARGDDDDDDGNSSDNSSDSD